jgi:hypothetical protein
MRFRPFTGIIQSRIRRVDYVLRRRASRGHFRLTPAGYLPELKQLIGLITFPGNESKRANAISYDAELTKSSSRIMVTFARTVYNRRPFPDAADQ